MKKLTALAMILLLILIPSRAEEEEALTVNGLKVSATEARLYLLSAESSYAEIADSYRDLLGIDYWTLTTTGGMTAAEAVKSDVFRELITMNVFYLLALENDLCLSDEERIACDEDARACYASLALDATNDIAIADVSKLMEKQFLADRMYSLLLDQVEIDEAAVVQSVNCDAYLTLRIEYLLSPATDAESAQTLNALREESDWSALSLSSVVYGSASLCAAEKEQFPALFTAAAQLSPGEVSEVIKTDLGLFVLRLIDDCDETAYQAAVDSAVYQARLSAFEADANALYAGADYTINADFWDSVALGSAASR